MASSIDYTSPSTQFAFDINKSTLFKKDHRNFINVLGVKQLNTLDNVSLLDIYLSADNIIEPHYHQNAAELIYCISGAVTVSILNPFTKQLLHYPLTPGQVANVPQGWWHYEVATVDDTHLLAIFNAPTPEVILGSDLLKLTPPNILSQTYCINETEWNQAISPVKPNTFIGSYSDCSKETQQISPQYLYPQYHCSQCALHSQQTPYAYQNWHY
ncbi:MULTISPECIES: cupin domain-containing protein [unclassified Solibacillus]|uniref:cupin domain-containing protein n=1 Tax=unclassified Solibacillus TaxID=2637870 RepID=UPI0030F4D01F